MAEFSISPAAYEDVRQIHEYIARDSLDAAQRFVWAVYEEGTKLAEMPGMGAIREFASRSLRGIRSWPMNGFENYLIFYFPLQDGIRIERIIHGARDIESALADF